MILEAARDKAIDVWGGLPMSAKLTAGGLGLYAVWKLKVPLLMAAGVYLYVKAK